MRKLVSEITLWLHLLIVLILFLMFFIPTSIWSERPLVHFYVMALIILSDLIFGVIYYIYKNYFTLVCPLTLIMQRIRGYKFSDEKNYKYSFVKEVGGRLGFKVNRLFALFLLIFIFVLTLINYIVYNLQ